MFRNFTNKMQNASNSNGTSNTSKFRNQSSKFIITLVLFLLTITVNATVYYVSSSGNDSNSGTSASSPWKSLSKVNSFSFKSGDQILFKRGDQWVGTITVDNAGTSGSPITFGAYGTGAKPKIYGSEVITGWTKHSGNIYKASFSKTINQLFVNDARTSAARYPNKGYFFITSTSSSTTFSSDELDPGINYAGAKWFGRTYYYTADLKDVKSSSSRSITLSSGTRKPIKNGLGFFLMNKLEFLDQAGEWYYDDNSNTVYLWTPKGDSPANYTIRGSVHALGFDLNNADNVVIQDLEILQQSETGIDLSSSDNVKIVNNDLSYPDGFGIYTSSNSLNYLISNNKIKGANHYGMFIRISHSKISDNIISDIALFENIGLTGTGSDNYGGGIYLAGEDGNNVVSYNRITKTGYNGILFAKPKNIIEYNFIQDACLLKGDMGGIYTSWYNRNAPTGPEGSIIRNNIVLNVVGEKYGYTSLRDFGEGIYIDESAKGVTIENNTVAHCTNSGIKLHQTESMVVQKNTILDARQLVHVLKKSGTGKSKIENNIMFAASDKDDYLKRQVFINLSSGNASYNYNEYVNPYASEGVFKKDSPYLSFGEWKSSTGEDGNSTINVTKMPVGEKEVLFYNDTKQDKTINLGTKVYKDTKGNRVTGSFVLKPFTSRILIGAGAADVVQNQSPVIADQTFNVGEAKKANDLIGQVVASDPDSDQKLTYTIKSGDSEGLLNIDPATGELFAAKDITLTANKTVVLVVEVKDSFTSPMSASANVTVNFTVPEQTPVADATSPMISSFTIPSTSAVLTVPVTINAQDNNGVAGWLLAETSSVPSSAAAGWQASAPKEYTFSAAGTKTLYAWVKDAAGNVSQTASAVVTITLVDETTTPTGDSIEYVSICQGQNYLGWTESGTYKRTVTEQQAVQNAGINLVANGDFKDGSNGWSIWGASGYSATMVVNSSDYVSAPSSLQLDCTANGTSVSSLQFMSKSSISVVAGKQYELTFYAKATTDFSLRKFVLLQRVSPYTHYGTFEAVTPAVTKEWKQFKVRFTATSTATDGSLRFYLGSSLPAGHKVYFDDITFGEYAEGTASTEKVVVTYLTVNPAVSSTEQVTIAQGANYMGWTESGEYTRTLEAASGCDSTVTTTLTVTPAASLPDGPYQTEEITICEGDNYLGWTESGVYQRTVTGEQAAENSGANMIVNGDFSEGSTGWGVWGSSGYNLRMEVNKVDYVSAPASLQLYCTENGTSISRLQYMAKTNLKVEAGKQYELSFYVKGSTEFGLRKFVLLKRTSPYTHYGTFEAVTPAVTREWKQHKIRFTATETATDGSLRIYLGNSLPEGHKVYFDNISFNEYTGGATADSQLVVTYLTVNPTERTTENVTILQGENYMGWTQSGVYTRTLETVTGCDSIITTNLLVTAAAAKSGYSSELSNSIIAEGGNDFNLYPNPAQTFINVEYRTQPAVDTRIEVVDANGRVILSQEAGSTTNRIDFNGLNPGMYYLRSVNKQSQRVEKFIVQ